MVSLSNMLAGILKSKKLHSLHGKYELSQSIELSKQVNGPQFTSSSGVFNEKLNWTKDSSNWSRSIWDPVACPQIPQFIASLYMVQTQHRNLMRSSDIWTSHDNMLWLKRGFLVLQKIYKYGWFICDESWYTWCISHYFKECIPLLPEDHDIQCIIHAWDPQQRPMWWNFSIHYDYEFILLSITTMNSFINN